MVQSLPQSDGFRILFNSPELSEVQRSGFHLFLKKGIAEELSKISCIQLKHAHFLIEIVLDAQDFRLVTPENNYRDCILKMKSYTCKLYVQTKIVFKDKVSGEFLYQTQPEWVLLADLPLMTKRGHFVINGSPRVIVHQVGRAPGVYFKKVLKIKKDVNNKARFYGDIIPRKGVWVRLQINKKGEIDLKLKKSKKVRAEMVQKCLELLEREATRENELLKMRSKLIPTKPNKGTMQQNPVKLLSSSVSKSRVQPPFLHLQEKFSISALHALPKRSLDTTRKGFVLPVSWKRKFFYSGDGYLESNKKTVVFSLTQKRLFFSIQTLFLTGITIDNCFYSKTRQTQAFVTGSSINKPETAIHPIWHNAKPWLTPIRKGSTRVRMICRLKKMVAATKPIPHFVTARFLSNDLIQTKSHLAAKPDSYQRGAFFSKALLCVPSFAEKPLFSKKDAFGSYARVKSRALLVNKAEIVPFYKSKKSSIGTEIPKLFSEIGFFQIDSSLKYKSGNRNLVSLLKQLRTKQLPKQSDALPKLMAKRSYTKTPLCQNVVMPKLRYTKLDKNEVLPCQSKALARQRVQSFALYVRQLLCMQRINPDLTNKLGFPLGSQMYGKTQSAFTKAEKEAFSNVYTSFYKNDIQDIKERASMSFVKRAQDSTKKDSLNPSSLSLTKLSTQLKSKPFKKRVATRKVAKKQSASSNLEKIREYLSQLFKRSDLYDLGVVGREKINAKFGISVIETQLTALDIKETINWLSKLRAGKEEIDDIDHSQNRRVRTSSELIQTQFEAGITRLRNVVTKKVRNGKIEQIKALPLTLRPRLSRTETKDLAEQSFSTCASLTHHNSKLIGYYKKNDVSQPFRLKEKSINSACFALPYFKGQGGCFVKNNKTIDKVKLRLKNKKTLTSINPYFITHQRKKKYYSNRSELKSARQKLHSRWDLLSVFHQPLVETHRTQKLGSALPKQLPKQSGTKTSLYGISFGKAYKADKMSLEEKTLFMPHIQSKAVTQDVLYPQGNRLSNFSVSELFSTKPINGALREFFSSSSLSQYMDQTNPLAEITHKRRISSLGVGGVSRESAGMAIRGIHPTHYGRICPIETPEGKNAGLVNSLAFYARINNQGFIETPYYQVIKGQIQHELGFSFYSAGQESRNGLYIAPNDIKQSKSKLLATSTSTVESIPVRVADNVLDLFKKVSPYKVDCIGISPVQILSVATSLIPFLEHNDANRALMGSNMQRQAVSLMISERPLIGTGLEAKVLAESGHLVQSKVSGVVSSVSAHKVVVERLLHNLVSTSCVSYKPNANIRSNQNSVPYKAGLCVQRVQSPFLYTTPSTSLVTGNKLPVTAFLEAGTLQISSGRSSLLAKFCFARISGKAKQWSVKERNMNKVELLPYRNLFSSQPSNVYIESSVARTQLNKYRATSFTKKKFALLPVTHSISTFSRSNQETCLVQKPLVEEGDWVQKGDMVSDCSAGQKGELSVGKNMLIAYIPWQGYNFEDAIVISDRLVKEQLYTSLHIERYTVIVNDFKDKVVDTNEWFTGNLPGVDSKKRDHLQRSGLPVIGTTLREGDILVGKIKYSKKKPATPHEKLVCDILGEHNFSVQNSSLYVPKGVHEARVLTYKIKKRFDKALKNNVRPAGAPKIVDIFLGEKRNIQVGDKMSGRHGNKGIVSTILPKQDMPYLADGSPIDILLNPLGVPSRMNVGQVFECLLGLASTYLHQNFKMTAFDELYGVEASQSLVFLKLYQARLQSGQNWLFQVNFPGKTRLTDGRSGECLDQWVTVGRAYMLKLIHMVNEKIHARAIGPYALVTQQPLKGRAHKGGQRLGEMEVWAIEGFGAAYILQELLTKKSDDSIGRKEVLKAMLPKSASFLDSFDPFNQQVQTQVRLGLDNESMRSRNENRSHNQDESFNVLGQPDIFKVLICELQALCLDVGVYSMKTESFQRQFLGILE